MIRSDLLNNRIRRHLLSLAFGAAAVGSTLLTLVSGGIAVHFGIQEAERRAAGDERDLTRVLTGFEPVEAVQNQLQLLVAAGAFRHALVVDGTGTVIASSSASEINRSLAELVDQPGENRIRDHLKHCLPPQPRLDCFGDNLSFADGPLPLIGGDHLMRFTQVPLALQDRGGYSARATLISETDLAPSLQRAAALGMWVFVAGLTALTLTSGLLVLRVRSVLLPELVTLAQTDPLTGVANRRAFEEIAQHRLDRAAVTKREAVIALVDVDRFKAINDGFGHAVGDQVVRHLASVFEQSLRSTDLAARLGGDEFVLLLDTASAQALSLLERLRSEVAAHPFVLPDGREVPLSLSIGVAGSSGRGGHRLPLLLELADASLYVAKEQGRNRVVHLEGGATGGWRIGVGEGPAADA